MSEIHDASYHAYDYEDVPDTIIPFKTRCIFANTEPMSWGFRVPPFRKTERVKKETKQCTVNLYV